MGENEWIAIEDRIDRLPEVGVRVLLLTRSGAMHVDLLLPHGRGLWSNQDSEAEDPSTHWRPLPEPPKPVVSKRDQKILDEIRTTLWNALCAAPGAEDLWNRMRPQVESLSDSLLDTIKNILTEHGEDEEPGPPDDLLPCAYCRNWFIVKLGEALAGRTITFGRSTCAKCGRDIEQLAIAAREYWSDRIGRKLLRSDDG